MVPSLLGLQCLHRDFFVLRKDSMPETSPEYDSTEAKIDLALVVGRLQEYGVEVELEDFEGLGPDDIMGDIAGYATMYDLDIDEILRQVTPIESRKMDDAPLIATVGDKDEI